MTRRCFFVQVLASGIRRHDGASVAAYSLGENEAPKVLATLARAAKPHFEEFNTQQLANTACAFAVVGHVDEALFTALARAAEPRPEEFNAHG